MKENPAENVPAGRLQRPASLGIVLVLALVASGCALRQPKKSDPASLVGDAGIPSHWTASRWQIEEEAVTGWIADFGSPALAGLVNEAVDRNYDLAATRARVEQAMERARITGAGRWPGVESQVGTSRSERLRGAAFQSVRTNNFDFTLNLSWELDIWGRVRDLRRADLDRLGAETNAWQWSRLSLAANVVKTTFDLIEAQNQVALSRRNLRSLQQTLDVLDRKLEAGDADDRTALDISLSRADIARARANIHAGERQADASRRTLETLLGRYPAGRIEALATLPVLGGDVPSGLPSELLLRRPDLLAAEARVDGRLKDLSASRKALLPAIAITGTMGTSTTRHFGDLFDIQNMIWSVGQNLTQPVFRAGRLRAEVRLDEHEVEELAATYAETALVAFREVETALAAEWHWKGQVRELEIAAREARRAEELGLSEYEKGLADIITVLEAQRRAFDAESSLLAARRDLLKNRVDLYLALGGDFAHPAVQK